MYSTTRTPSTSLWLPALAVALGLIVPARTAAAQSVMVRNAAPRSTVEVQLNGAAVQSGTASADGEATVNVELPPNTPEGTVRVYVDRCVDLVRVLLFIPSLQPPTAPPGCFRSEIAGEFVIRPVSTFLVSIVGSSATVRLRQGPIPPQWLVAAAADGTIPSFAPEPPPGLALFGGGGLVRYRDAVTSACGNVDCSGGAMRLGGEVGVTFWLTPFLGGHASFVKPRQMSTSGSGDGYNFNATLDTQIVVLAANVGGHSGRVRVYGQVGANYHEAKFRQTETIDDKTVTVDGAEVTFPGGTQTWELQTDGWGWLFGGGLEIWTNQTLAFYGEGQYAQLQGNDRSGGEGRMNDRAIIVMGGVRVRLGF